MPQALKFIEVNQNTDEWLKSRLGVATASEFSKVITSEGKESKSLKGYAMKLASEMLIVDLEPTFSNSHIERGNELENYAVDSYEQYTLDIVERVGFASRGTYGCSPDGLVSDDGCIEVKCPSQHVHAEYIFDNRVPPKYYPQVQGVMFVTGRKWCDFISYNPYYIPEKRLFIYREYANKAFHKQLKILIDKTIQLRDEYLKKIKG